LGSFFEKLVKILNSTKKKVMIYRSKAPLRIGLAGGGTDVSPYSDLYGGSILNATISLYAYANITPREDDLIVFKTHDQGQELQLKASTFLEIDGQFDLFKGVYNRVVKDYVKKPFGFELGTHVDAPAGSGLGTSSTLMVAILGAFVEWFNLPLGEYDIAHLAYEIERFDLKMAGGKQDQYAATFGGFNFMEFYGDDKVVVNPLRIKEKYIHELENSIVLYYTGNSRLSSEIIKAQQSNVIQKNSESIEAMHKLKEQSRMMKEALLKGELSKIGEVLNFGWLHKKNMTSGITNPMLDKIYQAAMEEGSIGGKISGAGGGGFMFFYCPDNTRYNVIKCLMGFGGEVKNFSFVNNGLTSWRA
jgi:D-glycero-alpha-D-manno-heptose-7-phosphate kinase